jgi:hypothetical protein
MILQLVALEHLALQGWSTTVAEGGDFKMRAIFAFLRIAGFSPYQFDFSG